MADLKKGSSIAVVYDFLKNAILLQQLKPGMPLTEQTLCDSLHVGRSPVRRAFQELAKDGFLDLIPNKGAYVISYTKPQIVQLYAIKNELETYAIALTVNDYTEDDFSYLQHCLDLERDAFERQEFSAYLEAIAMFHTRVTDKAGNVYLSEIFRNLTNKLSVYLALYDNFYVVGSRRLISLKNHQKIVASIREGRVNRASKLLGEMAERVTNSYDFTIAFRKPF